MHIDPSPAFVVHCVHTTAASPTRGEAILLLKSGTCGMSQIPPINYIRKIYKFNHLSKPSRGRSHGALGGRDFLEKSRELGIGKFNHLSTPPDR